jgi:zinc protease
LPRELSGFEIEAFFTFTASERALIEARRGPSLRLGLALQIGFLRMSLLGAASVQSDKTAAALLEMIAEVDAIAASRPPTVDEVERVKAHEIRTLSGRFETSAAIVDRLVQSAIDHRSDDYVDTFKQAVEALSLDEVAAAAQALFVQGAMTWVIIGDLDQVAASLRETGLEVQVFGADGRPL